MTVTGLASASAARSGSLQQRRRLPVLLAPRLGANCARRHAARLPARVRQPAQALQLDYVVEGSIANCLERQNTAGQRGHWAGRWRVANWGVAWTCCSPALFLWGSLCFRCSGKGCMRCPPCCQSVLRRSQMPCQRRPQLPHLKGSSRLTPAGQSGREQGDPLETRNVSGGESCALLLCRPAKASRCRLPAIPHSQLAARNRCPLATGTAHQSHQSLQTPGADPISTVSSITRAGRPACDRNDPGGSGQASCMQPLPLPLRNQDPTGLSMHAPPTLPSLTEQQEGNDGAEEGGGPAACVPERERHELQRGTGRCILGQRCTLKCTRGRLHGTLAASCTRCALWLHPRSCQGASSSECGPGPLTVSQIIIKRDVWLRGQGTHRKDIESQRLHCDMCGSNTERS